MKSTNHALTNHLLGLLCGKKQKHQTHDAPCATEHAGFPVEMWKDFVEDEIPRADAHEKRRIENEPQGHAMCHAA